MSLSSSYNHDCRRMRVYHDDDDDMIISATRILLQLSQSSRHNQVCDDTQVSMEDWNKLGDIILKDEFVKSVLVLYDKRDQTPCVTKYPDLFLEAIFFSLRSQDDIHKRRHVVSMKLGDFHCHVASLFPGFICEERFKQNKKNAKRRFDLVNHDLKIVIEMQNNYHTKPQSSKKATEGDLNNLTENYNKYVCIVNNATHNCHFQNGIRYISGQYMYEMVTGKPSFFNDLLTTITNLFQRFSTKRDFVEEVKRRKSLHCMPT